MKRLILIICCIMAAAYTVHAQNFSLRSSMTMLATGTLNIEASVPVAKKISVHLPVLYNPWVFGENTRLQQLTVMPGVRVWKQNTGIHYFYSIYGIASRFHFGGIFDMKYRYDGQAFGAGAGGGYSYVLSDKWNLDFEVGLGVVYAQYDKCGWQSDSHLYARRKSLHLIPTKLDISLSYFF